MPKSFLIAAALTLAVPAMAADRLPIDSVFGTPLGCAEYLNEPFTAPAGGYVDYDDLIYVTPTRVAGFEYGCDVVSVSDATVDMLCEAFGEEPLPETSTFAIEGPSLTFNGRALQRCE